MGRVMLTGDKKTVRFGSLPSLVPCFCLILWTLQLTFHAFNAALGRGPTVQPALGAKRFKKIIIFCLWCFMLVLSC